ncbi:MAG: hypothetical protein ACREIW_13220 [Chthoniobacterales bacterium]
MVGIAANQERTITCTEQIEILIVSMNANGRVLLAGRQGDGGRAASVVWQHEVTQKRAVVSLE